MCLVCVHPQVALVVAATEFGYRLHHRDRNGVSFAAPPAGGPTPYADRSVVAQIVIDTPQKKNVRYDVLNVLDFTSDRKRMTVVVRTPEGTPFCVLPACGDSLDHTATLLYRAHPLLHEGRRQHDEKVGVR